MQEPRAPARGGASWRKPTAERRVARRRSSDTGASRDTFGAMNNDPSEGEVPFDEEITIRAAVDGHRCAACDQQVVEGDRVRIKAMASDPLAVTHVRCLAATRN